MDNSSSILIRRMNRDDAGIVYNHISETLNKSVVNKVYEADLIDNWCQLYSRASLETLCESRHIYLLFDEGVLKGTGAIHIYEENPSWAYISMLFIDLESQGKGYGRKLLEALENDEYALKLGILYLTASLSALRFYQKLGWTFPGDETNIVIEDNMEFYPLIKFLSGDGKQAL